MADWQKKLTGLFGGPAKAGAKKAVKAPATRADILAEAMAIHKRERGQARAVLEKALKELIAKPPKPSDVAGMTRLLTLRQAVMQMRASAAADSPRPKPPTGAKGSRDQARPKPVKR